MKLSPLSQWVGKFKSEFSNWRKSFAPVLIFMLSISSVLTSQAESYVIQFDENDYQILTDDNGLVHISKTDGLTAYPKFNEPALPLSSFNIAIEGDKELVTSVPTFSKRLVKTNVVMARVTPQMLNDTLPDYASYDFTYAKDVYPISNCEFANVSEWTNIKILHYLVCPFVLLCKN